MINLRNVDYAEVGKRIKNERAKNGLSRERFAELTKLSSTYVSQLELGQRHASLPSTIRIASVLNISLDYLIYGDDILEVNRDDLIEIINSASKNDLKILKEILTAILPFSEK